MDLDLEEIKKCYSYEFYKKYKDESDEPNYPCELIAEVERLRAVLDGDPHQTETVETRRAWRISANRYADKLEKQNKHLRSLLKRIEKISSIRNWLLDKVPIWFRSKWPMKRGTW